MTGIYGGQYDKRSSVLSTGWSFTKEVSYVSEFIAGLQKTSQPHLITLMLSKCLLLSMFWNNFWYKFNSSETTLEYL